MKCTIVDNQPAIVFSGVTHIVTVEDMARIRMESGDVLLRLEMARLTKGGSEFRAHMNRASELVRGWPEWKRGLLGSALKDGEPCSHPGCRIGGRSEKACPACGNPRCDGYC